MTCAAPRSPRSACSAPARTPAGCPPCRYTRAWPGRARGSRVRRPSAPPAAAASSVAGRTPARCRSRSRRPCAPAHAASLRAVQGAACAQAALRVTGAPSGETQRRGARADSSRRLTWHSAGASLSGQTACCALHQGRQADPAGRSTPERAPGVGRPRQRFKQE